jgi:hypothetical protein
MGELSRQSHPVRPPAWSDEDPYTMSARLCDDDGIVRGGAMHHGTDYPCTGHAHFAGEHIRCSSAGHPGGLTREMEAALRSLTDEDVARLLAGEPLDG